MVILLKIKRRDYFQMRQHSYFDVTHRENSEVCYFYRLCDYTVSKTTVSPHSLPLGMLCRKDIWTSTREIPNYFHTVISLSAKPCTCYAHFSWDMHSILDWVRPHFFVWPKWTHVLLRKKHHLQLCGWSSLENNVLMGLPACFHTHGFSRISPNSKLAHKSIRMTIGRTGTKIEETCKLNGIENSFGSIK